MGSKGTVHLDDAVVEFLADGSGDPVVLVPGLGLDGSYFSDLSRRLTQAGFRAIAVNPRGAGASAGSFDGLTLHTLAADVAGVIESLRAGPVHLVGHGFGNRVARCLVTDRPDLVRSIVLLAGAGDFEPTAEVVRALRSWAHPDATEAECLDYVRFVVADPSTAQRIRQVSTRWPAVAVAQQTASRAMRPIDMRWDTSGAPILVVQGLADPISPPHLGHGLGHQVGDRVRVTDIPDAGHMIFLEQPDAVAQAMVAFFRHQ
jgi:pimeloyl-ACP methyl ester carboxylesterase